MSKLSIPQMKLLTKIAQIPTHAILLESDAKRTVKELVRREFVYEFFGPRNIKVYMVTGLGLKYLGPNYRTIIGHELRLFGVEA